MTALINDVFPPPPDLTHLIVRTNDQHLSGGCFGDVYRCWYNATDAPKQVAVKAFRFRLMGSDKSNKMIRRELGIWRRLEHNNIVPFLGIAYGFGMQGAVSLVSSWMPNGTLVSFLEKHDHQLGVAHRLRLLLDIAKGLHYLHSRDIVHGDLYCNNVLIDADRTARLVDFGLASLVGDIPEALSYLERSTTRSGALRWAAPERVFSEEGSKLTIKSDIYSFGCISLQESLLVLSGRKPWSEVKGESYVVVGIAKGRTPARPEFRAIDDCHWAFIERCWLSAEIRPSAKELITSIRRFLSCYPRLPPRKTSPLGGLGDGTDAKELLWKEEQAAFRNIRGRGISRQLQLIDPSSSTGKRVGIGRDGVRGEAEHSATVEHCSDSHEYIPPFIPLALFPHLLAEASTTRSDGSPSSSPNYKYSPPPPPAAVHYHFYTFNFTNASGRLRTQNHRSSVALASDPSGRESIVYYRRSEPPRKPMKLANAVSEKR